MKVEGSFIEDLRFAKFIVLVFPRGTISRAPRTVASVLRVHTLSVTQSVAVPAFGSVRCAPVRILASCINCITLLQLCTFPSNCTFFSLFPFSKKATWASR